MSKHKRAVIKQEKQNTPAKRAKRAKKEYYKSQEAKDKWDKKKQQRKANKLGAQQSEEKAGSQQQPEIIKTGVQQRGDTSKTSSNQGKQVKIPDFCQYLDDSEVPGEELWCKKHCDTSCRYAGQNKMAPAKCKLPEGEMFGGGWCMFNCNLDCPYK